MIKLVIVQGGQTGVDRGAYWGALDAELPMEGWMPRSCMDEDGPIPEHVASRLIRCTVGVRDGGYPARTGANVELADAVLLIVQDHTKIGATRGTALTLTLADDERYGKPWLAVDSATPYQTVFTWLEDQMKEHDRPAFKLMVAGPRGSTWPQGEALARSIVAAIGGRDVRAYLPAGGGLGDYSGSPEDF